MKDELLITTYLKDFVNSHLGVVVDTFTNKIIEGQHVWDSKPLKSSIAEIILEITKNEVICYVDKTSDGIYILWDLKKWKESADITFRQREYSHKQRVARFIFLENQRLVSKAYALFVGLEESELTMIVAGKLLTNNEMKKIKALGVSKLIEKEEEL